MRSAAENRFCHAAAHMDNSRLKHGMCFFNSCRTSTIWSPNDNFKLSTALSTSTEFVHETGPATAHMFDTGTEYVYFKAIWGVCFFTNTGDCADVS